MDVGFIGLGAMGAPMAAHLAAGLPDGDRVLVWARRRRAAEAVPGAIAVATPREMAASAGVIVTMLPDLPELEEILEGPDGVLAGVSSATVLVVCSTSSPAGVRALAERVGATTGGRLRLVDAPVSGGVEGARAGTLAIMAGGTEADVALVGRLLAPCGATTRVGPLGAGQVAKACNQLVVAATTAALAEAAVLAERSGLDVGALMAVLAGGYAGSRLLEVKGPRFAGHDHRPASPARFMTKDLGIARAEAAAVGVDTAVLDAAAAAYAGMVAAGLGDLDSSGLQEHLLRTSTR